MQCCRVSSLHLSTESTTVLCKSGATKSQLNQLLSHTDSSCVCLVPSSSPLCYNPYFLLRTTFPSAYDDDHTGAVLQCTTRTNVGCTFHIIPSFKAIQREVDEKEDDECLPRQPPFHHHSDQARQDSGESEIRIGSMATLLNDKHKEFVINWKATLSMPTLDHLLLTQTGQSFNRSSIL